MKHEDERPAVAGAPESGDIANAAPLWRDGLIVALFFLSGASGLMYEVLWSRMLTLEMGSTAYSLATILTIFMGGLALGSYIGGRLSHRIRNGVAVYGVLEVIIGVYCLALPMLILALHPVMGLVYRNFYHSFAMFNLVQFALAAIVLILPVTMMGATLPIIAEHLTRRRDRMASSIGLVYGVNTIGAFVGCMVAGLVLVPWLGVSSTNAIAVSVSVGVGLIALAVSRGAARVPVMAPAQDEEPTPAKAAPAKPKQAGLQSARAGKGGRKDHGRRAPAPAKKARRDIWSFGVIPQRILLLGFGLSGFAAMSYQVAWTRVITLSIGSATYAFTLIVGAFILGLALGAAVIGRIGDRLKSTSGALIWLQFALAIIAAGVVPLLGDLPVSMALRIAHYGDSFVQLQGAQFITIFLIILAPTFLMGGMLPLVCKEISRSAGGATVDVGAAVGKAYASNTIGTILGAFAAGFILIPLIGMRGAILTGVALNAIVAASYIASSGWLSPSDRRLTALGAAAAPVILALLMPAWNRALLISGPYITAQSVIAAVGENPSDVRRGLESQYRIVHFREGVATTVTIAEVGNDRKMLVGGKPEASPYSPSQALLAHLPLLTHPNPERVLIIGLGGGNTLVSALMHPEVKHIDCIEISPEVRDAAATYFDREAALADPRVNMIIGDGRLHLAMTDQTYDVVISQPSNPWMVGASALFTREAFALMRERLAPGGVACVWVQGFSVSPFTFNTLVSTFNDVFDQMDLWDSRVPGDYFLTGSAEPRMFDHADIHRRMRHPDIYNELTRRDTSMFHAADFLGGFITDQEGWRRDVEAHPVSTDDLNILEARIPREMYEDRTMAIAEALVSVSRSVSTRVAPSDNELEQSQFERRADNIHESRPLLIRILRRVGESPGGTAPASMLRELAALNPNHPISIQLREQEAIHEFRRRGQ